MRSTRSGAGGQPRYTGQDVEVEQENDEPWQDDFDNGEQQDVEAEEKSV